VRSLPGISPRISSLKPLHKPNLVVAVSALALTKGGAALGKKLEDHLLGQVVTAARREVGIFSSGYCILKDGKERLHG